MAERMRIAVRQRLETVGFFAAFAGIRLAADPVHGDGERGVRLAVIEPKLMAPVAKRLTMFSAGSTSSIGTGLRPAPPDLRDQAAEWSAAARSAR